MKKKHDITICCGWSGDDMYPIEYVNKLYRAVERNTTIPHDFLLRIGPEAQRPGRLTGLNPKIRVYNSEFPSWWVGMEGSQKEPPGINTASIFGIGLDCVIVGNIDDLLQYPSQLAAMKDYPSHSCPVGCEGDVCMEVVLSRNGALAPVWDEYVRVGMPTWDSRAIPPNVPWRMAHQGWINSKPRPLQVDPFPEDWICSYKLTVLERGLPKDCKIVSFHGKPKPHEVNEKFIKDNWK